VIKRAESLAELNKEAWRVLVKELGVVKAIRFLGQFDTGSGNYATDRDAWQEGLTVDQIIADIQRRRSQQSTKKPTRSGSSQRKKPGKKR